MRSSIYSLNNVTRCVVADRETGVVTGMDLGYDNALKIGCGDSLSVARA